MENSPIFGLIVILTGGFFEGIFMLPEKWCKAWKFEHVWLAFSFFCYLLLPWLIVRLCVSDIGAVFAATPGHDLWLMGLYATGWALAALSFGIGINLIGVSLGFAIIFGLAAFVGALVPLLTSSVSPSKFFSVLFCLVLMLIGVSLCSFAGRWREKRGAKGYLKGVAFCIVSGLLGATGNMGFVAGSSLVSVARSQGLSLFAANSLVLAYLCLFMFAFNGGYAIFLLARNSSFPVFLARGHSRNFVFTLLMGVFWMIGFLSYGYGALALGKLGLSLGWGVFMCTVVASANGVGILTGEWQAAPGAARRQLAGGLVTLVLAIAGLAAANSMN
jgi:L-rhamnose-H+ transport protein